MKQNKTVVRILSTVLVVAMLVGAMSLNVFAALPVPDEMIVISDKETTLAPGITQNETVIYDRSNRRVELFVATADLNVSTVGIQSSYFGAQCEVFGMSKMTEQVAAHQAKYEARGEQYTAVVGMNGSYYNMNTGQPEGAFYMEGVNGNGTNANGKPFFAILKDGTPYIGRAGDYEIMKDQIWESVGANEVLVWEGKNLYPSTDNTKYPRSVVGLTADNKVIFLNANGNQSRSAGLTRYEAAQLLIEKGCVAAVKYDEGGSATYVTKPQGSDSYVVTNKPSDGSERPVSTGLIIYSTAKGSGMFDSAVLTAENDYVTPYSEVAINAVGSDDVGGAAEIPAEAEWYVDEKYGTIEAGIFKSNGTVGAAKIQLIYKGEVTGETTVNVVIPDIAFESAEMVVPYGKTFELIVTATTNNGVNPVAFNDSDIIFKLSDAKMGSINGKYYTTCAESSGVTGGTITAVCVYDNLKTASATITFGKASTILYDFEDGSLDGWNIISGYTTNSSSHPVFGRFEEFDMKIVDRSTGKVRNGNKALEIMCDYSVSTTCGWKAIRINLPTINVAGATTIGMWMYIPSDDLTFLEVDVGSYEYYAMKDPNVGEEGWYYVKIPTASSGNVSKITIYMNDSEEIYFNALNKFYLYIDDITLDYSNAVEDRENPKFENVYISEAADSNIPMNGQTITSNMITVKAQAKEDMTGNYTGLNTSSTRVYIDGVQYTGKFSCTTEGVIIVSDISLEDGTHTFRFEIEDKAGNVGFITRQVVVNSQNGEVYLARRYNKIQPLTNSIEYFDIIAKDIEKISSLKLSIDLDNLSKWELQGAEVVYGFTMDYSIDKASNTATISLIKTGGVEATGETVIAALPVRVWGYNSYLIQKYIDAGVVYDYNALDESKMISTPSLIWANDRCRLVRIELDVAGAVVEYADGTTGSFSSLPINILTENNRFRAAGYYNVEGVYVTGTPEEVMQGKKSTHIHTAEVIEDKAATCTTAGYSGRTYCDGCESVVDWGTIIPATGHNYAVVDGVLKCGCGKVFNGVYTDGKTYVDGVVVAEGWNADHTKYYKDGVAVTGIKAVDGYYCEFAADGTYIGKYTGKLFSPSRNGYVYVILGYLRTGWIMIDDAWHYFNPSTCVMATGTYTIEEGASAGITYQFAEDGNLTDGVWHTTDDGKIQYFYGPDCYKSFNNTLEVIHGKTYCFDKNGYLYRGNQVINVGAKQPIWFYEFDEVTGELIEIHKDKNGVVKAYDGKCYYLVDGLAQRGLGMITFEGDNYYVKGDGTLATGEFYIKAGYMGCGHLTPGYYDFGEDGKFIGPVGGGELPEPFTGVKADNDGVLHYYVNDKIQYGLGMITFEGSNYYIKGSGVVATGEFYIKVGYVGCEHLTPGYYDFGTDGKFIGPVGGGELPESFTGVKADNDGVLHYYVNDSIQYGLGMITFDNANYYITGSGRVVTGKFYIKAGYIGCGHLTPGYYDFGADGKFVGPWSE